MQSLLQADLKNAFKKERQRALSIERVLPLALVMLMFANVFASEAAWADETAQAAFQSQTSKVSATTPLGSVEGLERTRPEGISIRWSAPFSTGIQVLVEDFKLDQRLIKFVKRNFNLPLGLELVVHQGGEPFIDVPGTPSKTARAYIPKTMFQEMYASIQRRYSEQAEVRSAIMAAATERLLWQQFARLLFSQLEVTLRGEEAFLLDNFVSLMLLNLHDAHYLLDASEEYLVTERGEQVLSENRFESELAFDHARYQRITCLVMGSDHQEDSERLKSLAWDDELLAMCRLKYQSKLQEWVDLLDPHLKETAPMRTWLAEP